MNINGIGTTGYPAWNGAKKAQQNTAGTSFTSQLNNVASAKPHTSIVYMKTDDMLYSGGNGTGLSFYIKYAENSTEDDPTVIAKGVDENGDEFEQTIHINKINPKCASIVEMRALEAHLGVDKNGGLTSLPMGTGMMGLCDRTDFMDMFEKQISDMKLLSQKRTAAYYQYSMQAYWDFMNKKFRPTEDVLKRLVDKETEEAKAKRTKATDETQETNSITDMQMNMLVSETVQARFPLQEVDEEGNRKEEMYLIVVDKDGIRCSKPGQDEYEWEILFTDESQYENAAEFLNYAGKFMDNYLFAAHENFWEDYLNGNMDVDGFKEFLEGTNNGIPDYSFTVGDSTYIDKEKVQWAQYMNPLGIKFYTAEEMAQMQAELIEKNTATAHKLSDPYSILYKKMVDPTYNGERIFCEYPGGPLYTADEIMEIMNRNSKDAKYQAEARK